MSDETKSAQASAFAAAAARDFEAARGSVYVPELDMTLCYRLASAGAVRQAVALSPKGDEVKANAILVRDHVEMEDGTPIVTRDKAGLDFLLNNVRPAVLGRLAKMVGGATAEELGND